MARGQAGQEPRPQMAEEVFKNVQILKGIPVDEFMDTMGMFAAALSLNCVDCHTPESVGSWDNFADETPLKRTARRMMLMVNAINKDNFGGVRAVTCYTCHRGDLRPKPVPNLAAQYAEHVEDANEVVNQSVFPAGRPSIRCSTSTSRLSAERSDWPTVTSFTGKGTFIGFETEQTKVPVDVFAKAPNQRTTIVHTRLGDSVRVFDGRAAWIAAPDRPVGLLPLTGGNLEGAKLDAMLCFPDADQAGVQPMAGQCDGHRQSRGPGCPGNQPQAASGQLLLRRIRPVGASAAPCRHGRRPCPDADRLQ